MSYSPFYFTELRIKAGYRKFSFQEIFISLQENFASSAGVLRNSKKYFSQGKIKRVFLRRKQ